MRRSLVKQLVVKPPKELADLFTDAPVAKNENREHYERLFIAIATAAKPADAIGWMFVRDVADLSWEIQREKSLKIRLLKAAEVDAVRSLLSPPPKPSTYELVPFFLDSRPAPPDPELVQASQEARQWAGGDPKIRRKVENKLTDRGDETSFILFRGLESSHIATDAIDKRIASYELRRMAALRAIEQYDQKLARRVEANSKIIDGEFTEAAE